MFPPKPLRRVLDAAMLVRPRTIRSVATRADQSQREVEKLRGRIKALDAQLEALTAQVAGASAVMRVQERRIAMLTALHAADAEQRGALAASEQDLQLESASAHLRQRLCAAQVQEDPFPHAVLDDVLPARVYKHMLASLPPAVFFDERPVNRAQFLRLPFSVTPEYARRVWNFIDTLMEEALPDLLLRSFGAAIAEYLTGYVSGEPAPIRLKVTDHRLLLRRPGYVIPPHRDPRWGFLTMLIYLQRKGEDEDYGTQLYAATGEGEPATTGEVFYPSAGQLRVVRDVPARGNSALIFLNSHGAHGASIPADAPPDTERYVLQVRVGPDSDSARRLVAQMHDAAKASWGVYRGKYVG